MSATHRAVLGVEEDTVEEVARMLQHECRRRGTPAGDRASQVGDRAVLMPRRSIDG